MGACASFPKGMKDEAREAQLPEQPKDVDPTVAVAADVAEANKEIIKDDGEEKKEQGGDDNKAKEDEEKAIESSNIEGEIAKATKTTLTEEETTLSVSDAKAENATALVAPVTSD